VAVAIDSEIFEDAHLRPFNRDREISLTPDIGGGRAARPTLGDHSSGTPSLRRPAK
jgi:hypothetical protein